LQRATADCVALALGRAIACAVFAILGLVVLPSGGGDLSKRFDWVGASLGTVGMTLVCFAWNQAPLVGWEEPYVYALLVVGLVFLGAFVLWEGRMGEAGLVPLSIFTKEVLLVLLALWWGWMSFGTFLFYTSAFIRDVRGFHQPLVITAQMATLVPFGATAALALIWLFPRVAGHWLLAASLLAFTLGNLLMALAPANQSFWAMIFPAELLVVFGPDLSYASGALIIANSTSDSLQGVAAGLTLLIVNYSMSIGPSPLPPSWPSGAWPWDSPLTTQAPSSVTQASAWPGRSSATSARATSLSATEPPFTLRPASASLASSSSSASFERRAAARIDLRRRPLITRTRSIRPPTRMTALLSPCCRRPDAGDATDFRPCL
jgi:hypothetical protein